MKTHFIRLRAFLTLTGSVFLTTQLVHADTLYWDANGNTALQTDGAGAWLTADLWWNGTSNVTWTSADNAIFGNGGAGGAVTLASPTTIGSLTFNYFTGTYTIGTAGQAITLNNGITKNAGSGIVAFDGPLVLGAAQTWTNNSTSAIQSSGAATLNNGGFNLTFDGAGNFLLAPSGGNALTISGSGGIIKNGTGQLNLDANPSIIHTFTGDIVVNGGSIGFQTAGVFTDKNTTLNGGYLGGRFNSSVTWTGGLGTGANQIQITGGVSGFSGESNSSSAFTIGSALSTLKWGATGVNGATGFFNPTALLLNGAERMNANGTGILNNGIDLNGSDRTFTSNHTNWDGAAATGGVINGAIVNTAGTAAGVIRTGIGNISLIAANTYNGATTIYGGTLTLRTAGTANSTSALNLGGGTLRLVNTANTQRFADVAISATAGGGITYENTAGAVSYTESFGALTLTKGQVNVLLSNDHNAAAGSQTLTFGTAGTGNLTQGVSGRGTITFSAPTTGLNASKNRVAVFGATASGAGNIVGPWATLGTATNVQTSYAAYDASGFVVAAALTAAAVDTDLSSSTGNYNINTGSTFTLAATRTVNAVQFQGTASTLDLGTNRLETNGLLFSGGTTETKTITGTGAGALTTASGGGNLYITTGRVMTAGSEHRIDARITDNSGILNLVKSGAGTLRLNGANTFTGAIDINAGTLQIGTSNAVNNATLGNTGTGTGTYAGNIFIGAGANLDYQSNSTQTLGGIISGDGNLLQRYNGTLTLGDDNTYTGKTTIGSVGNHGSPTLVVSSFNSYNGGTPLLTNSSLGAPTTLANATIQMGSANSTPNPTLRYAGAAATGETTDRIINFTFNTSATRTLDASGSGLLKFTSPFTGDNLSTGQLALTGTGTGEIAALPFLFGNLTKSGAGTWTINGAVGNTGITTVSANGGTLALQQKSSLLAGNTANWTAAKIVVNTGGTLAVNVGGAGEFGNGDVTTLLTNIGGAVSNNGLRAGSNIGFDTTNATGGSFTIADAIANTTGTGGGAVGMTKRGTGTLVLTSTNTYTGATTVSGGTLLVNGSLAAGSAVSVNAGALGGTGVIGGTVSVSTGATLAPGASIESLVTGAVTMASGSVFAYEVANNSATGADLLTVNGALLLTDVTLSLDSASLLALAAGSWSVNDKITLINYGGSGITSGFAGYTDDTNYNFGGNVWMFNYNDISGGDNYVADLTGANFVTLTAVTIIPEPKAALLGFLGVLLLFRRRR